MPSTLTRVLTLVFTEDAPAIDLKALVDASDPVVAGAARYRTTATPPVGSRTVAGGVLIAMESAEPIDPPAALAGGTVVGGLTIAQPSSEHPVHTEQRRCWWCSCGISMPSAMRSSSTGTTRST